MKFLTLTLLVIISLCASYKVRKEPFTPSVGIIAPSTGDDSLTDNYLEMVNQPSKKLVSMGIHDVDLDKNIAIGDRYEDVVYVKDGKSKSAKASRFAKKQDDSDEETSSESGSSSNEERSLDDLLDVEFQDDVGSAEEAFNAVMRHQEQILAFLDEVSQVEAPSAHQSLVIKQLFKYVKLVQQAHDLFKFSEDPEDEKFIKQIAASIHQYTFLLDEQKYNEAADYSTQKRYIGKTQKDNQNLVDELDENIERVVYFLDDGSDAEFDELIATEHATEQAQKAVKIIQLRTLIDKVKHADFSKNPAPQVELLNAFVTQLKAEKAALNAQQVELDRLAKLFTDNEELNETQIQELADAAVLGEKLRKAARDALFSLEKEDEYQAEVKLQLIENGIREHINDHVLTDAKLAQQRVTTLHLIDAINDNDMHAFEELCKDIINEVAEDQEVFVGDEQVSSFSNDLQNAIRKHNWKMVPALAQKIAEFVKTKLFPQPSYASMDEHLTEEDKVARKQSAEVSVLAHLTKAAKDLTAAEDRQQAEDFIEQLASLTQQMNKVSKFRQVVQKALQAGDDADKLTESLYGLDLVLDSEHDNLTTDRDQMEASQEAVEDLAKSSLTEEWQDSHKKALTIVEEENLNALARWSVLTAAQYIQLEVDYEVKTHLQKALFYIGQDLKALEKSLEAVENQKQNLDKAHSAAQDGDADGVVEALEELIIDIQTEQPVVEVDVEVEANAETAMELLADGKIEEAVDAVNNISVKIVDPHGEDQYDIFAAIEEQPYGNGIHPVEGNDINDVNKSPETVAVENLEEEIETHRAQVEQFCEEENKLEAEAAFESLFAFAQRQYKNLDFATTLNAVKKAQEVGAGADAYEKFLVDFHASNEDETAALKNEANNLLGFKESVQTLKNEFESWTNTEAQTELRELYNQQEASNAVKVQINLALEFLENDKRASAVESIEDVAQRVEEEINDIEESVSAIESQQEILEKAQDAAKENDFETVLDNLERLETSITEGQKVILTDERSIELLESTNDNLREGAFGDVLNAANELAENLTNEVNANREAEVADPTASPSEATQEADAEELERDVENAEELVTEGTELEALEAIEHVEQETQKDAKNKLVEEVKSVVENALENDETDVAVEATESLIEILQSELATLEGVEEEVEEVAEQIEEVVESDDAAPDEVEEEAEELLEEAEEVEGVPAKVEAALEEAQEDAEEGNVGDADEKLEEALEEIQEQESQVSNSVETLTSQIEQLETAVEAIENEDSAAALLQFTNVANSIQDQSVVAVSDDAAEKAEEAKEAVAEGEQEQAAELVEDVVEVAEEEVEEDLDDAEIESPSESESESSDDDEDKGTCPEDHTEEEEPVDEELVAHVEDVIKVLTPEDPAEIDQDACLAATKALKDYDGSAPFEVQIAQIEISIEADDYDGAAAQAEALLTFLHPTESEEEEDDGITKRLLPSLKGNRFNQIKTKAMKKAEKKIAAKKLASKRMVASLKKKALKLKK